MAVNLEEFNHWWIQEDVDPELALPFKRDAYFSIEKHLDKRFIIALVGLRRVGKTTIMYQLIQKLLKDNISPESILFFSFDEVSVRLREVIESYHETHSKDLRAERVYIFLDEIQKCGNWENELKKYYDLYPKLKFFISGSESLFIKKKTKETLAGRMFEFTLAPFSFGEYLRFHHVKERQLKYASATQPFLLPYIERGGFPETFSMENARDFKEYVRALVVDKIIYKDIPRIFKIEDPEFLKILLELIATNPGMYVDYLSLSKQFGKDRRVIKDYLFYLQESFLIILLGNYRKGSITTLRKKKRAYPADNALTFLYKPVIEKEFLGKMVETLVVSKLQAKSFWKNGGEVDIIHEDIPIEVKYQESIGEHELKSVKEFMRRFRKRGGMLITKHDEKKIQVAEGRIILTPLWRWLLQ